MENNKYKNGKIYKIIDNTNNNVYIGSTINTLNERLRCHKKDYKRYLEQKGNYHKSFDIIQNQNFKIELIENFPCNSKQELCKREGEIMNEVQCINKYISGRTDKQYYLDNKEKIKQHNKQYYYDNIEKCKETRSQYNVNNKEKIKEYQEQYRKNNQEKIKEYKKQYNEDNKQKIKEKHKQYYLNNKEKTLKNMAQKIQCEICGKFTSIGNISKHKKSKKCQEIKNTIENNM